VEQKKREAINAPNRLREEKHMSELKFLNCKIKNGGRVDRPNLKRWILES
jgi:hypothetical protein